MPNSQSLKLASAVSQQTGERFFRDLRQVILGVAETEQPFFLACHSLGHSSTYLNLTKGKHMQQSKDEHRSDC